MRLHLFNFVLALGLLAPALVHADVEPSPAPHHRWYVSAEAGFAASAPAAVPGTLSHTVGAMERFEAGYDFGAFHLGGAARFVFAHSLSDSDIPIFNAYQLAVGPALDAKVTRWLRLGAAALAGATFYEFSQAPGYELPERSYYVGVEASMTFELGRLTSRAVPYVRLSGSAALHDYDGGLTFGCRF